MPKYAALLRAINVGGRHLKMSALVGHFHALGFGDATTFTNSGNVVFSSKARNANKLAASIEAELEPLLGFRSEVFLRTQSELESIAEKGHALLSKVPEGGDVNVAFLATPLTDMQRESIELFRNECDAFECGETEVYWLSQRKQSESKFSNAAFERKLKTRTTFRRASMLVRFAEHLRSAEG